MGAQSIKSIKVRGESTPEEHMPGRSPWWGMVIAGEEEIRSER